MSEPTSPDDAVDEALDETFPASDAPANTGETGVRIGRIQSADEPNIHHDTAAQQFVITVDGVRAFLQYDLSPQATTIVHTEVPESLEGRGLAGRLAKAALTWAHTQGKPIRIVCPFVRAYVKRHPELL